MEKYQIKSEIDHILDRSGTYVGSIYDDITDLMLYQPSTNRIINVSNQAYNAGLQKLFDEILSNSIDEHRRNDSLFNVNTIQVKVFENGKIIVRDNGGIPVQLHKQASKVFERDIYIPELIFGILRTSSNYDDTQDRNVVGTNGLGAKLTNIFSKNFTVTTADGKNKIKINWKNNMRECEIESVVKCTEHFTQIEFDIDLERFDKQNLSLSCIRQMQKRCIDGCATNPNLTIVFESDVAEGKLNNVFRFESFNNYAKLYFDNLEDEDILNFKGQKFELNLITKSLGYNIGFVNGALCSEGTHIKVLYSQICQKVLNYCKKNNMELITEKDIQNRLNIFVSCTIRNPSYDSQTKTKLSTKLDKYNLKLDESFLKKILDSNLIKSLELYYEQKYAAEKKKETKKLNALLKSTKASTKLISCTSNSSAKELLLFEGTSASAGFRKFRDPSKQSAYLLRGKVRNTYNLDRVRVMDNQELREIIALLGLQFDEPQKNIKNLSYSKIIIYSDADSDGSHIASLIIAFFAKHFPEIIRSGRLFRALTPIIVAYNPKTKVKYYYYSESEYKRAENNLKGFEIRYTKGLGGLDDTDYEVILRQQKLIKFNFESIEDIEFVQVWFDKDTTQRKQLLLDSSAEEE